MYQPGPGLSDENQREELVIRFHRFLSLLLEEVIEASRRGKSINQAIVADQAQKMNFFCLKAAESYKDCSLCLIPSREFERTGNAEGFDLDSEAEVNVYDDQNNPAAIILDRSVRTTVWRQLTVASANYYQDDAASGPGCLSFCKEYLF